MSSNKNPYKKTRINYNIKVYPAELTSVVSMEGENCCKNASIPYVRIELFLFLCLLVC